MLNQDYILTDRDRSTFRRPPEKKVLPRATVLYQFRSSEARSAQGAYWLTQAALDGIMRFAKGNPEEIMATAKSWLAIKKLWKEDLRILAAVKLSEPCWAWQGAAHYQVHDDHSNVLFMGNADQIFLPGLKPEHAAKFSSKDLTLSY